jgi:hypothetical protein
MTITTNKITTGYAFPPSAILPSAQGHLSLPLYPRTPCAILVTTVSPAPIPTHALTERISPSA